MARNAFALPAAALLWTGVCMGAAVSAQAVELTTVRFSASGTEELRCGVVNVGKKPAKVLVELVDSTGADVATLTLPGCDGVEPLAPHQFCSVVASGPVAAYCRITSSSKRIRGAATLEDEISNEILHIMPATR